MSGRVGDLSPYQEKVLEQFRHTVADIWQPGHDDYFFLRWLRARNFDIGKAEAAVRKSQRWRKEIGADTLLTHYDIPEVYVKYFAGGHLGFTKEGSPVRYIPMAADALDFEGGVKVNTMEGHMKFVSYIIEQDIQYSRESSKRLGKVIEGQVYIIDMKGCSLRLAWNKKALQILINTIRVYEDNYPEQLKKIFVINFIPIFIVLYNIGKRYFCEEVIRKFHFYSTEGWKEPLLEEIDADVLPVFLGGTRVDPDGDPKCPSVLKPGGIIDPKYYLKNLRNDFCDKMEVKNVIVGAKSEVLIEVEIPEPETLMEWEFLTEDHDIGAGLLYKSTDDANDNIERLMPIERVDCCITPAKREFCCERRGIYVIQFDNTYSWFRQKDIKYRIHVTPPVSTLDVK